MTSKTLIIIFIFFLFCGCSDNRSNSNNFKDLPDFLPDGGDFNILIISFDALRADALGIYGSKLGLSPTIDKFASSALTFDNANSTAQSTPTSFAAIFTGKLPFKSFIGWKMIKGQTIANVFQNSGYNTAFISGNAQLVAERHFDQGFNHFNIMLAAKDEKMLPETISWLEKNHNKKFFAWFHFLSPHDPYDYREIAKKFYTPNYQGMFEQTANPYDYPESEKDIKRMRELYNGEVFFADYLFKQVMNKMTSLGLDKNTIVILTADHGEEFYDHGDVSHDNLFEEVINIPLIIKHPAAIKSGRTKLLYSNVDLLPTLATLLELPYQGNQLDGVNLYRGTHPKRTTYAVSMTKWKKAELSGRQQDFKLLRTCLPEKNVFLYNLQKNPGESVNYLTSEPAIFDEISENIHSVFGKTPCETIKKARKRRSPEEGLSSKQIKSLKSLGYLK